MRKHMVHIILASMMLGIVIGYLIFTFCDAATAKVTAGYISLIAALFLRLIKMIIAPLVLATLVVGIAHIGDSSSIGRIFAKTMIWFITASLGSLLRPSRAT